MYDSITASDIPRSAAIVAGYIDHPLYTWKASDWALFPNAVKVRIAINASTNAGDVLDVERYDATPDQAPGWIRMRQASGLSTPTIYCNYSSWPAVKAACAGLQYDAWIADYDNNPTIYPGACAHQYINEPLSGGHYDLSSCADYWPRLAPEVSDLTPEESQWLKDLHDTFIGNPPQAGVDWLAWSRTVNEFLVELQGALLGNPPEAGVSYLLWSRDVTTKLDELLKQSPVAAVQELELTLTGTAKPPATP